MGCPKQIICLRHAEKTADKSFTGASQKGCARAVYLAKLLSKPVKIEGKREYRVPEVVYCFNKHSGSNRSVQLIIPFCLRQGILPNIDFSDDDEGTMALVDDIFTEKNNDKVVCIVWEHNHIPMLCQALGERLGCESFRQFQYWGDQPNVGVKVKGKRGNDRNNFYTTVVMTPNKQRLICFSQSNKFDKQAKKLQSLREYRITYHVSEE